MRLFGMLGLISLGLFLTCGCSERREYSLKDELCPSNIEELVSLSADELERVDLGRMNLICAEAASGSEISELPRLLRKLDEWAETAKRAEEKYRRTFERNPERYDNSYAKFKAVNLILTVKEDFKCRYQMSLVESGELHNVNSPAFFKNPDDVFISGLLKTRRGTCTSYAPLIVALGRRLGYPLYLKATNCEGSDREKLDWFKIINIAGERLTDQELRNAVYTGEWLHEAKKYFSKTGCPAAQIADKYLAGAAIRQDYLETALGWIAAREGCEIEDYMAAHQHDTNCNELWLYFQGVVNWVDATFPNTRVKLMKGLDWGLYFNRFGTAAQDPAKLEKSIVELLDDEDVTNQRGIYEYLLDGDARHLSIRAFTPKMARTAYERQKGVCPKCGKSFALEAMQADHITPWSKGGRTVAENCQMLCAECNRRKSDV